MAQVVRKHFGRLHTRIFAYPLHFCPNLLAAHTITVSCEKNLAGSGFLLFGVFQQLAAQLVGDQDGADLTFQGDLCPPCFRRLHGEVAHLADPDSGGTDGLHQQGQPLFALCPRRGGEGIAVSSGQLSGLVPEQPPLDLEKFGAAVLPAQKAEQAVEGSQRSVDRGRGVALGQ